MSRNTGLAPAEYLQKAQRRGARGVTEATRLIRQSQARQELSRAQLSSWYMEDAMRGEPVVDRTGFSLASRAAYLWYDRLERRRWIVLTLAVLVTISERPLWCLSGVGSAQDAPADALWEWHLPEEDCRAPDSAFIYLSRIPYLPIGVGVLLELAIYVFFLYCATLERRWRGETNFWQKLSTVLRAVAALLGFVDALVFVAMRQSSFRLAPYCRMLLCASTPVVTSAWLSCTDILVPFFEVVTILVIMYSFVAWVFAQLMDDWEGQVPRCAGEEGCPEINVGFETLGAAVYSLAVAATNQDLPSITGPSVAHTRYMALLWAGMYVTVNLLVLNVPRHGQNPLHGSGAASH